MPEYLKQESNKVFTENEKKALEINKIEMNSSRNAT